VSYERLSDEQEVSSSAPPDERALAGLTPAVMVLVGAASVALWILWILLCLALIWAWTPDAPSHWSPG
jgi:hypothetical protein